MSVNDRQVGGSHYVSAIQHWDMVVKWHVPYLEAQVMKYVTRCHKKNKRQDLEKALHFAEKAVSCQAADWIAGFELQTRNWFYPRALPQVTENQAFLECREYARANGLDSKQELLCWMAMSGSHPARLVAYLRSYMDEHYPEGDATRSYVNQDRHEFVLVGGGGSGGNGARGEVETVTYFGGTVVVVGSGGGKGGA